MTNNINMNDNVNQIFEEGDNNYILNIMNNNKSEENQL